MKFLILALATGLGLGLVPFAPGTVGTLLGIPLAYFWPDNLIIIFGIILIGIWTANQGEHYLNCKDSPHIVIDEIAGYLIAMYHLPVTMLLPAFILFRIFDIWKPTPIRQLQALPGGWGIMADDVVAGIFANLILQVIKILLF